MKQKLKTIIMHLISIAFWINLPKNTVVFIKKSVVVIALFMSFFILLVIALIGEIYMLFAHIPLLGILLKKFAVIWQKTAGRPIAKLVKFLDSFKTFEVRRTYLIFLAFENLRSRKGRTAITIAGMSFGVGIIVLLLSLGYGIEKLVIGKVTTLGELSVIDVSTGGNTAVRLNHEAIKRIEKSAKIDAAVPLISVVGRISINKATTDVLVYSTTNEYFDLVNTTINKGELFSNNKLSGIKSVGTVAGASTKLIDGKLNDRITLNTLKFNITPEVAATVWDRCTTAGQVLGYTARVEGGYEGQEFWGSSYYSLDDLGQSGYDKNSAEVLGKWVKAVVPLYQKNSDETLRPVFDDVGVHQWADGCIQKRFVQIEEEFAIREVLGEATSNVAVLAESSSSATLLEDDLSSSDSALFAFDENIVGTDSAGIEFVDLQSQEQAKKKETASIAFKGGHSGQAVVSTGLLALLGISESNALNTTFKTSLIIGKSQISDLDGKALSDEVEYKIIGVIEDPQAQYFYIPFSDSNALGITNYSQAKIVLSDKRDMADARKTIEDLGFRTASTADTVAQIESLFANLRIILGLLGLVALGVASLGMFNTLTVSLLERTREIGGMKTIGMVTDEVRDLFLSEAMIMGLSGGIGGLVLGFIIGKSLSLLISIFALTQGGEFIDLTHIPPFLMAFIIVSAFIVGLFTGLYPAMRARKISALNALRYE